MKDREGVIKFHLEHVQNSMNVAISLTEISAWRTVLFRLGLIGKDPERYDNLGFGNISQRLEPDSDQFIISGSQTGHVEHLKPENYCLVIEADPWKNRINSCGPCRPSSESMTHASIYHQNSKIQAVVHVHCPEIWNNTVLLKLPHIPAHVPYGTVDMAEAVEQLYQSGQLDDISIFTMLGHVDGVVSFGSNMQAAILELIMYLSMAIQIEQQTN